MKHEAEKIIFFGGSRFSQFYLEVLKNNNFKNVFAFSKLPSEEEVKKIDPVLGVIAYFGEIIPKTILEIPRLGFINVHYSLLPRWRGAAPIQSAILAGDKEIGVTILIATEKVDAGPILATEKIVIDSTDTYLSLEEKLIDIGSKLLLITIPKYLNGEIKPQAQDESKAIYAKKLKKENGKIDWSLDAVYIEAIVRAFNPWPGAYSQNIKVKKAEIIENSPNLPIGTVFKIDSYPAVKCGKNALKLLIVQPEGKKEMSGEAFLHGHWNLIGKKLG